MSGGRCFAPNLTIRRAIAKTPRNPSDPARGVVMPANVSRRASLPPRLPDRTVPPAASAEPTPAAQVARPHRLPTIPRVAGAVGMIPAAPAPDDNTAAMDCEPHPL